MLKMDNVSFSYDNSKNNCNLADINQNIEKGEAIKNSTIDSEEIKKILKENLATVKINIKNKKKAIAQLEQEIVDEETKIKSLEYLLKNIENAKGDINE